VLVIVIDDAERIKINCENVTGRGLKVLDMRNPLQDFLEEWKMNCNVLGIECIDGWSATADTQSQVARPSADRP
jgi:hypothetical protein